MGLQGDVIISIYYISNGLNFEMGYRFLGCWDILLKNRFAKFHENLLRIDYKLSTKIIRSWSFSFNVTLGIASHLHVNL